jgi:hypothetical protein
VHARGQRTSHQSVVAGGDDPGELEGRNEAPTTPHRPDAPRHVARLALLVGHPQVERASFGRLLEDVVVEHQLAHLLLEPFDLFVLQGLLIARPCTQGVLRAEKVLIPPILDFGHRQSMSPSGLLDTGFSLEDSQNQRHPAFRHPALYAFLRFLVHVSHSFDLLVACLIRGFNSQVNSILLLSGHGE